MSDMPTSRPKAAAAVLATAGALARGNEAHAAADADALVAALKGSDEKARGDAWFAAGKLGAAAVAPLAELMADKNLETRRAATRGLWQVTRHAGRPDAETEKGAVVGELLPLLDWKRPAAVRREVLWMLSELGGDECVEPIAVVLRSERLREDARGALERLPGAKSLEALQAALEAAPPDFKPAIAQSLRNRGVPVRGFPCLKRVPMKQTEVKPL